MFTRTRILLVAATIALGAVNHAPANEDTTLTPALTLTNPDVLDQDDMCIWVHPTDPARSTIITSDKTAGHLFVYGLDGSLIQTVANVGKPGNIDIRNGFPLGGREVSIVAFNERNDLKVHIYAVDPETRTIARVDDDAIQTGMNYGLTLYRSPRDGAFYAITVPNDTGGFVEQYRLDVSGDGAVSGTKVRSWPITESEGCAADDQTGTLYIGEEKVGIWRVGAEPADPAPGELVHPVGAHGLTADVEGLALLNGKGDNRYLLASSQGSSRFMVYRLDAENSFVMSFAVEGATDTDGIDVSPVNFGGQFPGGVFTLHNGAKVPYPVLVCDLRGLGLPLE
ncbi:MAG: phytase [Candidatus Hydrogenedentes bacterium]|nr:phytase [Candidatus Hydrogenedentota bacterium]